MKKKELRYKENIIIGCSALIVIILILMIIHSYSVKQETLLAPEGINYHNNQIQRFYSAGQEIKGSVNLSFSNALANTVLTSNFPGNMTLIEFLENNDFGEGDEFTCTKPGCEEDYARGQQITSVNVDSDGEIIGFSISGRDVSSVQAFRLGVSSDAAPACNPQLHIDVLNQDDNLILNTASSDEVCSGLYRGCFNEELSTESVIISTNSLYCENITLPAAPGFRLRANVKNSTQGYRELKMLLYDGEGSEILGQCILPSHNTNDYQELRCDINYSSPRQSNYFVCITPGSGNTNADYKIKYETSQNDARCGTNNFQSFDVDYDISVRVFEFAAIDELQIDEAFMEIYNEELRIYVEDYIANKYDGNCENGCSIPIEIFGMPQGVVFSNAQMRYTASQGTAESNNIYKLELEPARVNSGTLKLNLEEANFIIPLNTGERSFKLYANNELVFEQAINVSASFDFDVTPRFVAFGQNALFVANSSGNINSSRWTFGDDSLSETVVGKEIRHRYLEEGEFELQVTLFRSDGVNATKTFDILVGDAREIGNRTIADYKLRLINITADINSYEEWVREDLRNSVNLNEMNVSLKEIENRYSMASSDEEFQEIMQDLIELNVPSSIDSNVRGEAPLVAGFDAIDVSYIESISGESVEDEEILRNRIAGWMEENFDAVIKVEKISASRDYDSEVIVTKFIVETNPKKSSGENYLIIANDIASGGKFKTDYGEIAPAGEGYSYILLSEEVIEFYVIGEFEPEELGAYISPQISRLGEFDIDVICNSNNVCEEDMGESKDSCPADCGSFRIGLFLIMLLLLLGIALAVYLILQEWYKRNYQAHLFRNDNELYNIINFIYNARKSALSDKQIREKLGASGWNGEQINYAFNKIEGKRTGMYEIPIFKSKEAKKVREEIQKRQRGMVDTRFIKRRGLE